MFTDYISDWLLDSQVTQAVQIESTYSIVDQYAIQGLRLVSMTDYELSIQFGLLPGHSCTMQLLHVMDIITSSLDHGLSVDVIYLDLQKAFDSVPHNRLLCEVESYGIYGKFPKVL